MIQPRQKQLIEPKDWERVQAIRQVAHARSLYTWGIPRASDVHGRPSPRTVLMRADNDNKGLVEAMINADILAQTAEICALGIW